MTNYQKKLRKMRHTDLIGEISYHEEIRFRLEGMLEICPLSSVRKPINREISKACAGYDAVYGELVRRLEGAK